MEHHHNKTSYFDTANFTFKDSVLLSCNTSHVTNTSNLSAKAVQDTDDLEFFKNAQFINGVILYPIICFPGLLGNMLSLIVLSSKNMCTSTNAFLSALAVADSIKLISDIVYFSVMVMFRTYPEVAQIAYIHIYPYAHFVFTLSACISAWLTVSVAIERYILVCHPTYAQNLCTRNRAILTSSFVYLIMVGVSLPCAFRYRRSEKKDIVCNITITELEETELWKESHIIFHYKRTLKFLSCLLPLLILVFLNMCIINALRKTRAKRKHAKRHRVTLMMIIVIMVFLFCITPDAVMSLLDLGYYEEQNNYARGIREYSDTLLAINAAVNFIIYCGLSRTFRQNFASLFCGFRTRGIAVKKSPWYRRLSEQSSFWIIKKSRRSRSV